MTGDGPAILLLSPLWLLLPALVLLCVIAGSLRALHRLASQPPPELGAAAHGSSLVHRWEPRCKLIALLGFALFAVTLTSPWLVGVALLVAGGVHILSGLPWHRPLRRLQAISGFLVMLLVVLPLTAATRPGDPFILFEGLAGLAVNLRGLELAMVIAGKACTVALLAEPLLATAPPAATMAGLQRLGLPPTIGSLLLMTHRYLFVFRDEMVRMRTGMQARGFRPRTSMAGLHDLSNVLGMLLVRSYERTERVQQAMLARGYRGSLPQPEQPPALSGDWVAAGMMLTLGLALLVTDRLVAG